MKENMIKRNPLIPLMNEGLGELKCRRHFVLPEVRFLFQPIRAGGSLTEGGDDDKIHIIHYRTLETAVHTAAGRE